MLKMIKNRRLAWPLHQDLSTSLCRGHANFVFFLFMSSIIAAWTPGPNEWFEAMNLRSDCRLALAHLEETFIVTDSHKSIARLWKHSSLLLLALSGVSSPWQVWEALCRVGLLCKTECQSCWERHLCQLENQRTDIQQTSLHCGKGTGYMPSELHACHPSPGSKGDLSLTVPGTYHCLWTKENIHAALGG
jgi:hypothetical protein